MEPYVPLPIPSSASPEVRAFLENELARIAYFLNNLETGGTGGASELSDLSDVNTSTPTNRNALIADGVDWESRALVEADISDLGTYTEASVNETITGEWTHSAPINIIEAGAGALHIEDTLSGTTRKTDFNMTGFNFKISATDVNDYIFEANRDVTAGGVDFIMTSTGSDTTFQIGPLSATGSYYGAFQLMGANSGKLYGMQMSLPANYVRLFGSTSGYPDTAIQYFVFDNLLYGYWFANGADVLIRDGGYLRIQDSTDSDHCKFSHDGIDFNFEFTGTTDVNFTNASAYKIDGNDIATSDGTTGGTGSAGAGNQYVELLIGGTTYKLLHDGTV